MEVGTLRKSLCASTVPGGAITWCYSKEPLNLPADRGDWPGSTEIDFFSHLHPALVTLPSLFSNYTTHAHTN